MIGFNAGCRFLTLNCSDYNDNPLSTPILIFNYIGLPNPENLYSGYVDVSKTASFTELFFSDFTLGDNSLNYSDVLALKYYDKEACFWNGQRDSIYIPKFNKNNVCLIGDKFYNGFPDPQCSGNIKLDIYFQFFGFDYDDFDIKCNFIFDFGLCHYESSFNVRDSVVLSANPQNTLLQILDNRSGCVDGTPLASGITRGVVRVDPNFIFDKAEDFGNFVDKYAHLEICFSNFKKYSDICVCPSLSALNDSLRSLF